MKQLFTKNLDVSVGSAYTDLRLRDSLPKARPYVVMNMIASVDGRAAVAGRSKALGGETDRELFLQLRTQVDGVLVGTHTIERENYGRLVRRPELIDRRRNLGLQPEPLAVVVTRSMSLPLDAPLFNDPKSRIVVFTNSQVVVENLPETVEVVRIEGGELRLRGVFERLRSDFGVEVLLAEGGPSINAALLAEELVDELFLTVSPNMIGGREPATIVDGELDGAAQQLELVDVLAQDDFLFLHYKVGSGAE